MPAIDSRTVSALPIIDEDRGYAFTLIAAVSWDGPGPANLAILKPPGAGDTDRFQGIPLTALGTFHLIPTEDVIPRRDGERLNLVAGYVGSATLPATALGAFHSLWTQEGHTLPAGVRR